MSASSHNTQRACRQTLTHETTSRGKLADQGGNPVPVRGQEYGAPDMSTPPAKGLCNSLILRRRLSQMHLLHTCAAASLRVACHQLARVAAPSHPLISRFPTTHQKKKRKLGAKRWPRSRNSGVQFDPVAPLYCNTDSYPRRGLVRKRT